MVASSQNRIVVTGLGVFSAAGATVDELWRTVLSGRCPAQWRLYGGHRIAVCAAPSPPRQRVVAKMDRSAQMALAAAQQAWSDAQLAKTAPPSLRIGVVAGTSRGPVGTWAEAFQRMQTGRMLPSLSAHSNIVSLTGALAIALQAHGPSFTVSAACASSANAIALAAQQILLGAADVMLAGGTESSLHPLIVTQSQAAGILGFHSEPAQTCRPFAKDRNGTILGEGAAFLVLESARSARERGARVHARLSGWSVVVEGYQRTGISESARGMRQAMAKALARRDLRRGKSATSTRTARALFCGMRRKRKPCGAFSDAAFPVPPPNRSPAIAWARLRRWKQSSASSRSQKASCRPRPTVSRSIPIADWTSFTLRRVRAVSVPSCPIPPVSGAPMPRWF